MKYIYIVGIVFVILVIILIIGLTRPTTLTITSTPDNIEVFIGPDQKVTTPTTIDIKAGTYHIWGLKEGYDPFEEDFEVKNHVHNKLEITLTPAQEPPEGAPLE